MLLLPKYFAGESAIENFGENINRPAQFLRTVGETDRTALPARVSQAISLELVRRISLTASQVARHCEEQRDEAIRTVSAGQSGLLRFARDDGTTCDAVGLAKRNPPLHFVRRVAFRYWRPIGPNMMQPYFSAMAAM